MSIFWVDGEFVSSDKAMVSVNDIALLRGFGVFDFLRTYNRIPFKLKEHIQRFKKSGEIIGLDIPYSVEEIEKITLDLIDKNPEFDDLNVRFLFTGGVSSDNVMPEGNGKLILMATKRHTPPAKWYSDGIKVITVASGRATPSAKSINYLPAVKAQLLASKQGAVEALYCDEDGVLLEGTTVNAFFVKDGKIITHDLDGSILPGITRLALMEILSKDYEIICGNFNKNELQSVDEVFISASNKEIVPVVRVDDIVIGDGKVGAVTKDVMEKFRVFTDNYKLGM